MPPKASRDRRGCANMRRGGDSEGNRTDGWHRECAHFSSKLGQYKHYFWPTIGVLAVIFCGWLLYKELRGLTWSSLVDSFAAIPASGWFLAVAATLVAYLCLAEYDRIALIHLRRKISWPFVMVASFTTYSLSHNIGASLLSGTIIRFRAYGSRGPERRRDRRPRHRRPRSRSWSARLRSAASSPSSGRRSSSATSTWRNGWRSLIGARAAGRAAVLPRRLALPLQAADHRRLPRLLPAAERRDPPADHRAARTDGRRRHHLFLPARRGQSRVHHRRRRVRRLVLDGDRLACAGRARACSNTSS